MKTHTLFLAAAFLAIASPVIHAETPLAPATIEINGGSGLKPYRVSLNELYFPAEGIRAVDAQSSLSAMKELLGEVIIGSKTNAFLVLYPAKSGNDIRQRVILTDEIVIEGSAAAAAAAAQTFGVQKVEPFSFSATHYKVTVTNPANTLDVAKELSSIAGVKSSEPQLGFFVTKHAVPNDPLFIDQWHLQNTGKFSGSLKGLDLNVAPVWDTYRGAKQVIGIVDDGVDLNHEDLVSSINRALSYDYLDGDAIPSPVDGDSHGTACAGIAAATGFNDIGVVGVAPAAQIAAIRLMHGPYSYLTSASIASALAHKSTEVGIKSCSFGFEEFNDLGSIVKTALDNSLQAGRNGKGVIFVFAAGNGAPLQEANYSYTTTYPGSIVVGAVDDTGKKTAYSEVGACLTVVAPSWATGRPGITTTDNTGSEGASNTNYYNMFNGTSASCPMVSGVVALMLEAQPSATWNSVQDVLIRTARKVDSQDKDWVTNGAGLNFNHKYGAGLVNAEAAVAAIRARTNFPKQISTTVTASGLPQTIPDNNATGVTLTIPVSSNIKSLEQVVVTISAEHAYRGDLDITLTSPQGTVSKLATKRLVPGADFEAWPFLTVRNWGENPNGNWTLKVADTFAVFQGKLTDVKLEVRGLLQAPPPIATPGDPVSNVSVDILEPQNLAKMSARSITVQGSADAPDGIEKIEYQHLMFGTSSEGKNHGNPRISADPVNGGNINMLTEWLPASGQESWKLSVFLKKGDNHVRVRAISKDGTVSPLKVVRIIVP